MTEFTGELALNPAAFTPVAVGINTTLAHRLDIVFLDGSRPAVPMKYNVVNREPSSDGDPLFVTGITFGSLDRDGVVMTGGEVVVYPFQQLPRGVQHTILDRMIERADRQSIADSSTS